MPISTVLVALDQSPVAEAALAYAEAIARALAVRIVLLSVVEAEPRGVLGHTPEVLAYVENIEQETAAGYLRQVAEAIRDRGIPVDTRVVRGSPVDAILAAADGDTLVVIASHGRGGLSRLFLGSVADKVMRLSDGPVLVVRGAEADEAGRQVALHRLLVPLDGSPRAESALPLAAMLGRASGAELILIRVEPWLAAMAPAYGYVPDLAQLDDRATLAARAYLDEVLGRLGEGIRARALVPRGAPAVMLQQAVEEERIDLVVMSTHGAGGFRRFLLGSTADRMIRAGVPTLLARANADAGPPAT